VGRGDASLSYTATMLGFALGNLWLGRFVDRFGLSTVLTAGRRQAGRPGRGGATNVWFASVRLLVGTGASAGWPLIAMSRWSGWRRVHCGGAGQQLRPAPPRWRCVGDRRGWLARGLSGIAAVPVGRAASTRRRWCRAQMVAGALAAGAARQRPARARCACWRWPGGLLRVASYRRPLRRSRMVVGAELRSPRRIAGWCRGCWPTSSAGGR
jgi:hypothetical protein